jgi:hypothetical protein
MEGEVMTRDEVIRMMEKAVNAAYEAGAAAEREACIEAVLDYPIATDAGLFVKQGCAAAIRARGEK